MAASGKPWEKYAPAPAATGKPWEKYAASQATTSEQSAAASKQPKRTLLGAAGEAITNIPASAGRMVGGIVEAVTSPVQTLRNVTDIAEGGVRKILPDAANAFLTRLEAMSPAESDRYAASPEGQAQTKAAADALGGFYKQRYGSEQGFYNALATDPVGIAADVSTVLSGGAGAARLAGAPRVAGALKTAAQYTNPMTPVIAAATSKPVRGVAKLITNPAETFATGAKANLLLEAADGREQTIINALRSNQEIVPGSRPFAGQAAAGAGAPRYAQLQAAAEGALPTEYLARREAQEAARLGAVRSVGKDEEALALALEGRASTAKGKYTVAGKQMVEEDANLATLMETPAMRRALNRAKEIADNRQEKFSVGEFVPEETKPSALVDEFGNSLGETTTPAQFREFPVQSLHYVKMALDDMINDPATFGIGSSEAAAVTGVRQQFLKWLEDKSPKYAESRQTFASQSKPINQMEVGQYLEGKLTGAFGEGAPQRAGVFGGAMKEAPATIKRAVSGAPRFEKLADILTPEQLKAVEQVRQELLRDVRYERQAKFGREAGPRLKQAATQLTEQATGGRIPSVLNPVVTAANAIWLRLQGKIDRQLAIQIATEMLDPESAAAAMQAAVKRRRQVQTVKQAAKSVGQQTVNALRSHPALATGQINNALAE